MHPRPRTLLAFTLLTSLCTGSCAQDTPPPPGGTHDETARAPHHTPDSDSGQTDQPTPEPDQPAPEPEQPDTAENSTPVAQDQPSPQPQQDRPPQVLAARQLGLRAASIRTVQNVIPTVVIAGSPAAYCEAIASWDGSLRFPVLYDDGTPEAAEHIARFVRAFEPDTVVRHESDTPWPGSRAERELRILRARNRSLALDASPDTPVALDAELTEWLTRIDYPPPGAVVTDVDDPAWTGALALSAGRLQPLLPLRLGPFNPSGVLNIARADAICEQIERALDDRALVYSGLGDLDAITLVAGVPGRINTAERDNRSLTDRIGRPGSDYGEVGERVAPPERWAWAGQVFGNEAYASYAAMCSLFLDITSLWGFDTYDDRFGTAFRIPPGADLLEEHMGFAATVHEQPNNSIRHWRAATRANLDHDLVFVNSHGNAPEFNFTDGRAYAGDVPLLNTPAAVQFVHSFSMQRPDQPNTVGARWLLHGAYAYIGSVHEPYLDAFVPPQALAARLAEGWALGAAARQHEQGWWRIACYGDPLITLGPAGNRVVSPLPLAPVTRLNDSMVEALDRKDYTTGVRLLTMLGRDHDAARLADSILRLQPEKITPEFVAASAGPLNRDGQHDTLLRLWTRSGREALESPLLADTLWASGRVLLTTDDRDEAMISLRRNLRPGLEAADAVELAGHIAMHEGRQAAATYLRAELRARSGDRDATRILNKAIREMGN